ncbi:hypothetical protein [Deinococcus altitudinis]
MARSSGAHEVLTDSVQRPALWIVAQGSKGVHVGADQYE